MSYNDEDNTYTIKLEAVTDVGSKITCNYTGRIQMVNYSTAPHPDGFHGRKIPYGASAGFGSPSYDRTADKNNPELRFASSSAGNALARTVRFSRQ